MIKKIKWYKKIKPKHIVIAVATTALVVTGGVVANKVTQTACHANGQLPDAQCTPGSIDTRVTQANIQQTICQSGYSGTVRPPVSYTSQVKTQSYKDYGINPSTTAELDHLISLELGGNPTDVKNLWVEVGSIPNPKDSVENELHRRVCAGTMSLQDAQTKIAKDWTSALK